MARCTRVDEFWGNGANAISGTEAGITNMVGSLRPVHGRNAQRNAGNWHFQRRDRLRKDHTEFAKLAVEVKSE